MRLELETLKETLNLSQILNFQMHLSISFIIE